MRYGTNSFFLHSSICFTVCKRNQFLGKTNEGLSFYTLTLSDAYCIECMTFWHKASRFLQPFFSLDRQLAPSEKIRLAPLLYTYDYSRAATTRSKCRNQVHPIPCLWSINSNQSSILCADQSHSALRPASQT